MIADVDELIAAIAHYVAHKEIKSELAYETARLSLADSLGCALLALRYPDCSRLLGPLVPNTIVPNGAHVPGTHFVLDPVQAAFNLGAMVRWLDYNDTWLAAEWAHPSDNIGGLLSLMDYLSRQGEKLRVHDLLTAIIKAYEIQGVLALSNSFNQIGLDHVIFVKIATAAVAAELLGADEQQICDAISQAWIDLGPLRTYRHAPNTGSRKSWAAGEATSQGVFLAMLTMRGEKGYRHPLTAKQWGLQDVLFKGQPLTLSRPLGSYVIENILFKIAFPAEFHAQTAVECALALYPQLKNRWHEIDSIEISTQESAKRIIDKSGPLHNPADRDHCLQYMVAIALLFGELTADHYRENIAKDPRIDPLREKMQVIENPQYTCDYLDPEKRSIGNGIVIHLQDGSILGPIAVEYPLGHRTRRSEALPCLVQKLDSNLKSALPHDRAAEIITLFQDAKQLDEMPIWQFSNLFLPPSPDFLPNNIP